jgi:hypothetical protein
VPGALGLAARGDRGNQAPGPALERAREPERRRPGTTNQDPVDQNKLARPRDFGIDGLYCRYRIERGGIPRQQSQRSAPIGPVSSASQRSGLDPFFKNLTRVRVRAFVRPKCSEVQLRRNYAHVRSGHDASALRIEKLSARS